MRIRMRKREPQMSMFRRRAAAVIASLAAALAGALIFTPAPYANAATGCAVTYKITNQWAGGSGAAVSVPTLGDAIDTWTLAWPFTAGQSVTQAWNATVAQTGTQVTAKNVDYNRAI